MQCLLSSYLSRWVFKCIIRIFYTRYYYFIVTAPVYQYDLEVVLYYTYPSVLAEIYGLQIFLNNWFVVNCLYDFRPGTLRENRSGHDHNKNNNNNILVSMSYHFVTVTHNASITRFTLFRKHTTFDSSCTLFIVEVLYKFGNVHVFIFRNVRYLILKNRKRQYFPNADERTYSHNESITAVHFLYLCIHKEKRVIQENCEKT